jgi:hypothetical protein
MSRDINDRHQGRAAEVVAKSLWGELGDLLGDGNCKLQNIAGLVFAAPAAQPCVSSSASRRVSC